MQTSLSNFLLSKAGVQGPGVREVDTAIYWIVQLVFLTLIRWTGIFLEDNAIQRSNNGGYATKRFRKALHSPVDQPVLETWALVRCKLLVEYPPEQLFPEAA